MISTGDAEFESRFVNWVRWCRIKLRFPHIICFSVERYYTPESASKADVTGWGDWQEESTEAPRAPRARIDAKDAVVVNRAFARLSHIHTQRCIKLYYFRPYLHERWIARKLGVHHLALANTVRQAKQTLRGILRITDASEQRRARAVA